MTISHPLQPNPPDTSTSQKRIFSIDDQSAQSIPCYSQYRKYDGISDGSVPRATGPFNSSVPSIYSRSSVVDDAPLPLATMVAVARMSLCPPKTITFGLPTSHDALFQPHPVDQTHKVWHHQQLAEGLPYIQNVGQLEYYHRIIPQGIQTSYENCNQYECRSCHKLFSRPSALNIHIRSHTGEKPFHCPNIRCERAFSVLSNMKRHASHCPMVA